MTLELLEARRAEALAIVEEIRAALVSGWESPLTRHSTLGACADLYTICNILRDDVLAEIQREASYAAFCRTQDMIEGD